MGERLKPRPPKVLSYTHGPERVSRELNLPRKEILVAAKEADITVESNPGVSPDRFGPIFASSSHQSELSSNGSKPESGLPSDRKAILAKVIGDERAVKGAFVLAAAGLATAIRTLGTGAVGVGRAVVEKIGGLVTNI